MTPEMSSKTLQLVRGGVVLGTIEPRPREADSPWHSGAFVPSPEFESVRELFEHELRLLRENTTDDPEQWDEWEAAHAELHDPGLRLERRDRSLVADDLLIHIEGAEAWWRAD